METAIRDLASDFTLAQALTAEQVLSIEKEFSELTERIEEELPLILNSYLEVASDAKGKRSLTEKFIRTAVDTFIKEVNDSEAWIFYSSLIRFNLNKELRSARTGVEFAILTEGRRGEVRKELINIRDSKEIDFLRFCISDQDTLYRLTRSFSALPWAPSKHKTNLRMHDITKPIKISKEDLINTCKSKKEQAELENCLTEVPKNEVIIDYFSEPFDLMIMEALTQDPKAKAVMMGAFASFLIDGIRHIRDEGKAPQLKLSSKGFDLSSGEEVNSSINLIIERYISGLLDHHISEISKEIEKICVDKNTKEWAKLQETISLFARSLRSLNEPLSRKALKIYSGDQEELILEEIFTFLSENQLNPCNIPTIAELGKHKGGYALVKSISEAGGLKSIRKRYVPWSIKKTRDLEFSTNKAYDLRNEINSKFDHDEDNIMALYASETADPGSIGINMSLEDISELMPRKTE